MILRALSPGFAFEFSNTLYTKIDKEILKAIEDKYKEQQTEKPPKTIFSKFDTNILYLRLVLPEKEMTPEKYYLTHCPSYSNIIFSTYPILNGKKFGKPIADRTSAFIYKEMAIFCLADGCGMGERPALSAQIACESFSQYVCNESQKAKHVGHLEKIVTEGIAYAQTMILQSQEDPLDAGLTTFIGFVLVKTGTSFAVIFVNLGDCSGMVIDGNTGKISDLIDETARRVDVKETGGRLGPVDGEFPELDNLKVGIKFFPENTSIILMSDGVCDNLDIKTFFESPKECGLKGNEWHVANVEHKECRKKYLNEVMGTLYSEKPEDFCLNVYNHIIKKTTVTREYKVNDVKGFHPGKMDHCSAAVIRLNDELFSKKTPMKKKMVLPDDLNDGKKEEANE